MSEKPKLLTIYQATTPICAKCKKQVEMCFTQRRGGSTIYMVGCHGDFGKYTLPDTFLRSLRPGYLLAAFDTDDSETPRARPRTRCARGEG